MNKDKIKHISRFLRKNMTKAEMALWRSLRDRQLDGYKFRRQHPIGPFIVDFVCLEKKLIIEVDGGQHADNFKEDEKRTNYFKKDGFKVLRFWNNDVLKKKDSVLNFIASVLEK